MRTAAYRAVVRALDRSGNFAIGGGKSGFTDDTVMVLFRELTILRRCHADEFLELAHEV